MNMRLEDPIRMTRTEYSHFLEDHMGLYIVRLGERFFIVSDDDPTPAGDGYETFVDAVEDAKKVLEDDVELVGQ